MSTVELTARTTPGGITYLVDPLGFPAERCLRCTGRGELPAYSHNHGGVCFDCKGTGMRYTRDKAGTIANDYRARNRPRHIEPPALRDGMTIRHTRRNAAPAPWRTLAGDPVIVATPWPGGDLVDVYHVTYTDGTVDRMTGNSLEARPDVEALERELAALANQARTLHERRLDRNARKVAA